MLWLLIKIWLGCGLATWLTCFILAWKEKTLEEWGTFPQWIMAYLVIVLCGPISVITMIRQFLIINRNRKAEEKRQKKREYDRSCKELTEILDKPYKSSPIPETPEKVIVTRYELLDIDI